MKQLAIGTLGVVFMFLVAALYGSHDSKVGSTKISTTYALNCEYVHKNKATRCENEEVLCYTGPMAAWCKLK